MSKTYRRRQRRQQAGVQAPQGGPDFVSPEDQFRMSLDMTSAPYNRGSTLAVDLGPIPDRPGANSYVLCQQLKSFDWRAKGARPHPIGRLQDHQLEEVLAIVGQILGLVV
jgi:mRNA-degrading endonuclease toxin of MazEF toxin-antitoxin module